MYNYFYIISSRLKFSDLVRKQNSHIWFPQMIDSHIKCVCMQEEDNRFYPLKMLN